MSKSVLFLSPSPPNGHNSGTLCQRFARGAAGKTAMEQGAVYGAGAWQLGDIQSDPAMREAYELGRNA